MGKPTGFLEYERQLPERISVSERVQHFREFVGNYEGEELNKQAARCMNCGVPFCHHGCPLGNIIPEFNDAVYREDWKEAYAILSATNDFPEFTGRICPAPCESSCVLGINQPPVAIEEIERHIIEIAFANGYVQPRIPYLRTGKKIAVIGSGPAGLAAAAQLNYAGHTVTVYERDDAPGGLLRYGIPDFKLDKKIIDRRLDIMREEGIIFRCNMHVGVGIPVHDLLREYHAIVLAGGSTIPRDLDIPGRHLKGIHFAMEFLKQNNKKVAGKSSINAALHEIIVEDQKVVVIGGGDTGSDCVGTANRLNAASVLQFELLPKPPVERNNSMPWPTYPMLLKTTSSHEEGVERHWAIATKEFIGNDKGELVALRVTDLKWENNNGRPQFTEVEGSNREIPCDRAFLALGFLHPEHESLINDLEVELDERGNVKTGKSDYQTNIPKIFSAGDMRRGQSLVVWAIKEGRDCADRVCQFLLPRE